MKKVSLCIATLVVSLSFAAVNPGKKQKVNIIKGINESHFSLNYQESNKTLKVDISGNLDSTASLSITNQRGSSYLFTLVEKNEQEISFNLSTLEKGIYNLMFISNDEIRIKKVELK